MKDLDNLNIEKIIELDFAQFSDDNLLSLYREYNRASTKYAAHLIRLLFFGIELLDTGSIKFPTDWAKYLIQIKKGEWPFSHIIDKATYLEEQLVNAYNHTKLPELPDLEAINKFQIKLIEGHWSNNN